VAPDAKFASGVIVLQLPEQTVAFRLKIADCKFLKFPLDFHLQKSINYTLTFSNTPGVHRNGSKTLPA
jgi:hypothetical protein